MLHQLDEALADMLRDRLPYSADELDVRFEAPDREFECNKPTLNMFLWDVRRSAEESSAGREVVTVDDKRQWRPIMPRMEFQYLLTAWIKQDQVAEEHKLLGESLIAILECQVLTGKFLPRFVAQGDPPPTLRIARSNGKELAEFWGAIEGKLKPGLSLIVSASIHPTPNFAEDPAGPVGATVVPVGYDVYGASRPRRRRLVGRSASIGAVVRSPLAVTTVDEHGYFYIHADSGDEIVVEGDVVEVHLAGDDRVHEPVTQGAAEVAEPEPGERS